MNLQNRLRLSTIVLFALFFSLGTIYVHSNTIALFDFSNESLSAESEELYRLKISHEKIYYCRKIDIHIDSLKSAETILIPLDGIQIMVDKINDFFDSALGYCYYAYESHDAEVSLSIFNDELIGIIHCSCGVYYIETWGKDYVLVQREEIQDFEPEMEAIISEKKHNISTTTIFVIRVAILYTENAQLNYGSADAFFNAVYNDLRNANQSLENSNINAKLELAYLGKTNDVEGFLSFDSILVKFRTPNDGYMDEIHTLRSIFNADICVAYIDKSEYCGLSTVNESSDYAFAVVRASSGCAGKYTFAHEIGHILGCGHDLGAPLNYSLYQFGHGYVHFVSGYPSSSWRTIMAYGTSCANNENNCKCIKYWSNPNLLYNGYYLGDNDSFNTLVWQLRSPIVSAFESIPQDLLAGGIYAPTNMLYSHLYADGKVYLLGNYNINAGQIVDVVAPDTIRLLPNTHIAEGSIFHAYISQNSRANSTMDITYNDSYPEDTIQNDNIDYSMQMVSSDMVNIFPNPISSYFDVNISLNKSIEADVQISIINAVGQVCIALPTLHIDDLNWTYRISCQALPMGLYLVVTKINQKTYKHILFIP